MLRFLPLLAMGAGVAAFAIAQFSGENPRPAAALTNCALTDESQAGMSLGEQMMLDLVNEVRVQNSLVPLQPSPTLNRAAAWMAVDMSGRSQAEMSHWDTTGRDPWTRLSNCGYAGAGNAGENIAWGSNNVCTIFQMWMQSEGHRANILNPNYRVIGIGFYGYDWVQDFGVLNDSGIPETSYWQSQTGVNCANGVPTPTPPTATATISVGPSETASPTDTPAATETAAPTETPDASETPTGEPEPSETPAAHGPMVQKAFAPMVVAEAP